MSTREPVEPLPLWKALLGLFMWGLVILSAVTAGLIIVVAFGHVIEWLLTILHLDWEGCG